METNERRKSDIDPIWKLTDFAERIFQEIYVDYKSYLPKAYNNILDNPLFKKIYDNINLENNENKAKNCDEVFFEYLKDMATQTNKDYFIFVFKFAVCFRESINKFKTNEVDPNKEYTEVYNSDQVPDVCNEFITEFMENADYFGMNSDDNKNEFIEIIQHFCFWMFDNGYTTSRLTLLQG